MISPCWLVIATYYITITPVQCLAYADEVILVEQSLYKVVDDLDTGIQNDLVLNSSRDYEFVESSLATNIINYGVPLPRKRSKRSSCSCHCTSSSSSSGMLENTDPDYTVASNKQEPENRFSLFGSGKGEDPKDSYHRPCKPRDFQRGSVVCVCTADYCDRAQKVQKLPAGKVQIYVSTKKGKRFQKSVVEFKGGRRKREMDSQPKGLLDVFTNPFQKKRLVVERGRKYQKILGLGGAFTDATGINVKKLSKRAQDNFIKAYFGEDGIGYSMARIPIGGSDFSPRPYTYDDVDVPDLSLAHFALQPEDHTYKIPFIKAAQAETKKKLRFFASPWSAPVWMKTNNQIQGNGQLRKEYYQVWAEYFVRFIKAYKEQGIPIWGVTTQNEPLNGLVPLFPFNSMGFHAVDMSRWIAKNLGPTLRYALPKDDVKIIMLDDNKIHLEIWGKEILDKPDSAQYVYGAGTHWYFDFLSDKGALEKFHRKYPNQVLISTEACAGFGPWELEKVILGSWKRGEQYLESIISDMQRGTSAWIDWNLAVDLKGGPNWVKLAADAAILVNEKKDEFWKQPIYYAMGHVSKFLDPDSVRIQLSGTGIPKEIHYVAFLRPDNAVVIVLLNKGGSGQKVSLEESGRGKVSIDIPGDSMTTLVYW